MLNSSQECGVFDGSFLENTADIHVNLRASLLENGRVLPPPVTDAPVIRAGSFPDVAAAVLFEGLNSRGLGVVQFDEALSNERFVELGHLLGVAMPETDPSVQAFVEADTILNLVSAHSRTTDVALQPFATNSLSLHSESSGRPPSEQPRYIVLMCCDPGDNATAAQTVLIPMAEVRSRLTAEHSAILSATRYRNSVRGPMLLRTVDGRNVFSFRDFQSARLDWTHHGDAADEASVNEALRALLASMYQPAGTAGVHWTRGLLVIIDNTFSFHGRTAGLPSVAKHHRHLKRLRIRGAPDPASATMQLHEAPSRAGT
jgi:hypothetical protein